MRPDSSGISTGPRRLRRLDSSWGIELSRSKLLKFGDSAVAPDNARKYLRMMNHQFRWPSEIEINCAMSILVPLTKKRAFRRFQADGYRELWVPDPRQLAYCRLPLTAGAFDARAAAVLPVG